MTTYYITAKHEDGSSMVFSGGRFTARPQDADQFDSFPDALGRFTCGCADPDWIGGWKITLWKDSGDDVQPVIDFVTTD
jgi:hypothetical protein